MATTPKPISERRLAANRANALRSTGPRTPEGKARSARNSRTHGLSAPATSVDPLQDIAGFQRLRDDAIAIYQPANSQELFAVDRIARAQQAILHCAALEAGLFSDAIQDGDPAGNPSLALAIGFRRLIDKSNSFQLFLRYQAQAEHQYRRAIEEFDRLKASRDEFPIEPNPGPESIETPPLANAPTNPSNPSPTPELKLKQCSPVSIPSSRNGLQLVSDNPPNPSCSDGRRSHRVMTY